MCPEPFRGQTAHPGHVHRVAAAWNHKYLLVKKVCVRNGGYSYGDMIDVCIIELKHAKTQHDSTVIGVSGFFVAIMDWTRRNSQGEGVQSGLLPEPPLG